jgi:hypothetical protein
MGGAAKIVAAAKAPITKKRFMLTLPQAPCQGQAPENRAFTPKSAEGGKSCREFMFGHG